MTAKISGEKLAERIMSLRHRGINMISDYVNIDTKATFSCLKPNCDHVWKTSFTQVYNGGTGCAKCDGQFLGEDVINERIKSLELRSIKLLGSYKGSNNSNEFQCLTQGCHYKWRTSFHEVFNEGTGCAKCSGHFVDESTIQKKLEVLKARSIKVISSYCGSRNIHEFECLNSWCKRTWKTSWDSVNNFGSGCPKCSRIRLTDNERSASIYREKIRSRISGLYKSGSIKLSVHKDGDYMTEIFEYCKTQVSKLPKKPNDNQSWHLDHIIPMHKFDHTDIEQVKLCWNHKNLQWLTQSQNCTKQAKLMPEYFNEWHYDVLNRLGLEVA